MRKVAALLLIGLLLTFPNLGLSKDLPLTDAQLEDVAALPDDPEPTGGGRVSGEENSIESVAAQRGGWIASVAAQRATQKRPVQSFAVVNRQMVGNLGLGSAIGIQTSAHSAR